MEPLPGELQLLLELQVDLLLEIQGLGQVGEGGRRLQGLGQAWEGGGQIQGPGQAWAGGRQIQALGQVGEGGRELQGLGQAWEAGRLCSGSEMQGRRSICFSLRWKLYRGMQGGSSAQHRAPILHQCGLLLSKGIWLGGDLLPTRRACIGLCRANSVVWGVAVEVREACEALLLWSTDEFHPLGMRKSELQLRDSPMEAASTRSQDTDGIL